MDKTNYYHRDFTNPYYPWEPYNPLENTSPYVYTTTFQTSKSLEVTIKKGDTEITLDSSKYSIEEIAKLVELIIKA